jgi:prephenate dehydrogenase
MAAERFKMTVVGFGKMGKRFAEFFAEGFDVQVISSRNVMAEIQGLGVAFARDFSKAIAETDYIFIAVPIDALDEIVEKINKSVRPETVAMDCCSARIPAEEKLARLRCCRFGLHNLNATTFAVFGSPDPTIVDYVERQGISIHPMTPEEHDAGNSVVALAHFVGMVLDDHLQCNEKSFLADSKAGSHILRLIDHLRANAPVTYKESQVDNIYTRKRRGEFIRALQEYDKRLSNGEFPFANL